MVRRGERPHKIADEIQRELSDILRRKLRDPRVGMITLTGVELSPDCAHATVYFTCLDRAHVVEVKQGLGRAKGFLRSQLARKLRLFSTPELKFLYDESVERGAHLAELLDGLAHEQDKH